VNESSDGQRDEDIEALLGGEDAAASGWTRRGPVRWVAIGLAALALAGAWWVFGNGSGTVRYVTEPVTRGDLTVIVTATGAIQPTEKVDVSSELSGIVRKVFVDYNSTVTAGQELAELDTDKLEATVDSSRARLAAAKAAVGLAQATVTEKQRVLERKKSLAGQQFASVEDLDLAQAEYDRAVASLDSARADVGVAQAELELAETDLQKACICSPIDGVVLTRDVDPGQTVASSLQAPVLFSIAEDLKQMELRVDVDEADVGQVTAGQTASFTVDAFSGRRFPASIRYIRYASETIQGVVTYKAVLDIDNSELLLRPGMTATAEITVNEIDDALLIPNAALRYAPVTEEEEDSGSFVDRLLPRPRFRSASKPQEEGRNRSVWVLKEGVPREVEIVTGASDGEFTEVTGGALEPGDPAIVDETAADR